MHVLVSVDVVSLVYQYMVTLLFLLTENGSLDLVLLSFFHFDSFVGYLYDLFAPFHDDDDDDDDDSDDE